MTANKRGEKEKRGKMSRRKYRRGRAREWWTDVGGKKKQRQQRKAGEDERKLIKTEKERGAGFDHQGERRWCQHFPLVLDIKVGATKVAASVAASIIITSSLNTLIHHKKQIHAQLTGSPDERVRRACQLHKLYNKAWVTWGTVPMTHSQELVGFLATWS